MANHGSPFDRKMESLLTALTEGMLDEVGRHRLGELVRDEPEARRLYLDYCQMHALLKSAHGVLSAVAPKANRWRRHLWTCSGVAAALVLTLTTSLVLYLHRPSPDYRAFVVSTGGDVHLTREGQAGPAQIGMTLNPGDQIQTGPESTVDLRLADGTTMQLGTESIVRLLSRQDGQCVELKAGNMACDVKSRDRHEPLVFATPHAEVTVLGTVFNLSAAPVATSVRVARGRVRVAGADGSMEVTEGNQATVDVHGACAWSPVCDLDFTAMKDLPPQLETVFCDSANLHTPGRRIVPGPAGVRLEDGGLRFADPRPVFGEHGLIVSRWIEEVPGDLAIEVEVSAGDRWSLGIAVDGDSFQGYRVIFAAPNYPFGITIDSLFPSDMTLLAQDPRQIPYDRGHLLRVERQGQRIRVWVDREIRIDTEVVHPLSSDRRRTFAISNFGASPLIRSVRVWKVASSQHR